jgi:hypothetical protein
MDTMESSAAVLERAAHSRGMHAGRRVWMCRCVAAGCGHCGGGSGSGSGFIANRAVATGCDGSEGADCSSGGAGRAGRRSGGGFVAGGAIAGRGCGEPSGFIVVDVGGLDVAETWPMRCVGPFQSCQHANKNHQKKGRCTRQLGVDARGDVFEYDLVERTESADLPLDKAGAGRGGAVPSAAGVGEGITLREDPG